MAQAPRSRLCVLCPEGKEHIGRDSHHLRPLEYGGPKDGEQILICPNCHTTLHRLEKKISKGELALEDITDHRWIKVLSILMTQKRKFESEEVKAHDARRGLSVHLSEEEQKMARFVKSDMGFSSLESMVKFFIRREFQRIKSGK